MLNGRSEHDSAWFGTHATDQHLRGDWKRRILTLALGLVFTLLLAVWSSYVGTFSRYPAFPDKEGQGSNTRTGLTLASFCFDPAGASGKGNDVRACLAAREDAYPPMLI